MPLPTSASPQRLFLITFDILAARGGDRRYKAVDRYLGLIGTLYRPAKQVRLVLTDAPPRVIDRAIRHRIGAGGGVMVLRVGAMSSIDIPDPGVARTVRAMIRRYGRR